jgi:RNA polymerase sigma-70 factor (ECF subfamily)
MATNETELMAAVVKGDAAAFTEIDNKWRPVLLGMLTRKTGSAADAEDLVQRTMFRIWQKASMFDAAAGPFSAWVCRMANNVLIDTVRSSKRKMRGGGVHHESVENHTLMQEEDFVTAIEEQESREQIVTAVREVIQSMPRPLRQACNGVLRGNHIAKVGDTLALSKGTVSTRLRLARERMRDSDRLMKLMGETEKAHPEVQYADAGETKKVQLELF